MSLVFSRYKGDLGFFIRKVSVEVFGVFAQGVLLGNFEGRALPSDVCTDKHHCSDVYAHKVYFDLKKELTDAPRIARYLISEMLSRHYVDRVIVGASNFEQLSSLPSDDN